jgi:hypothetical protein
MFRVLIKKVLPDKNMNAKIKFITLLLFSFLSLLSAIGGDLVIAKWKPEFFTGYGGVYELYKTEGVISKIIVTPYESIDKRDLLSVLKIDADDIGTQPRYLVVGDLLVDKKNSVLTLQNGEKWETIEFTCPILKEKVYGLKINGVIYTRTRSML